MPGHRKVTPSIKFASTARVKPLAQGNNTLSLLGLKSGPLDLEMSTPTVRPLSSECVINYKIHTMMTMKKTK